MRKIYNAEFITYFFDKKEAGLLPEGLLTGKDVSKPADFYVVFKDKKTKKIIGKARIEADKNSQQDFYKKKFIDNCKTMKITPYNFDESHTTKQIYAYLKTLYLWCTNKTTEKIYFNMEKCEHFSFALSKLNFNKDTNSNLYEVNLNSKKDLKFAAFAILSMASFLVLILSLTIYYNI